MKITGEYKASIHSSFVVFEIDEMPDNDTITEMVDNASCYEAIWIGKDKSFKNGIALHIGMDDSEESDLDLLVGVMSQEDVDEIKGIKENNY